MRNPDIREPLKELDDKQVYNICHGELYGALDVVDSKPITRKKALVKIALDKLDLADRKRHYEAILAMKDEEVLLITCDETPVDFGGSGGPTHVSAP